ncbi:MAG: hypothetical protein UFG06_03070 [Lachnospiraceae bacterium]|nr:hypothetical protein [Lachnospiraceae bacterium]
MRNLLETKELIKKFYSKNEVFIMPALKFLLAFIALLCVNGQLGYMSKINNVAVVLIAALLCSFLPTGFTVFFAAVFVLLHLFSLAVEAALVGFCLFFVMSLLFFRFSPKDSLVVLLTPICFGLRIPYVMPLAMGLVGTPASAISVGCGVIVYYLVHFISVNAPSINALDENEVTVRLRMVIDGIIGNKEMMITVAAFAFTVLVVYIIRRMSVDHSWTVAMIAGTFINVVILLLGDLMYDTNVSVLGVLFGSLISLGLTVVLQFFVFSVDYSRTEKVQFEDDEYYYYVKAVPKMSVAAPEKTVKHINTQVGRSAAHGSSMHQPVRNSGSAGRTGQRTAGRQAPSRTISTRNASDDFDDI